MTSVGFSAQRAESQAWSQDLHWPVLTRLSAVGTRPGYARRPEIVLHGPAGVGKTLLLRRLYWELFEGQDFEAPLLSAIAPQPFRPAAWARRFLLESIRQWVAYARRDARLAQAAVLAPSALADWCYAARLAPLADLIDESERLATSGAAAIEWAFLALEEVAERLGQPIVLMLDGAENAQWQEAGETQCLARALRPAAEGGIVRRIWVSRLAPSASLALTPAAPTACEPWPLAPLTTAAAGEFFKELAYASGIEYDPTLLAEYLPLWGGIPRWLANVVRMTADSPSRSLATREEVLEIYAKDIIEGATSRDLQSALHPPLAERIEPALLARVAEHRLAWDAPAGAGPRGIGSRRPLTPPGSLSRVRPDEAGVLARLASAGLASYARGEWRAPDVAVLGDALRLYVARHLYGEDLERARVALIRGHLVEKPCSARRDAERLLRDAALLMGTFKEQPVPNALLYAHLRAGLGERTASEPMEALRRATLRQEGPPPTGERRSGGFRRPERAACGVGEGAGVGVGFRRKSDVTAMPCSIGAFVDERPATRGMPSAVAWCFEREDYDPGEEFLCVGYVASASSIVQEYVQDVERNNDRLCRELGVGRVQAWIVTGGRFSPEAIERLSAMGAWTSDWNDFQALSEILLRAPESHGHPEPVSEPDSPAPAVTQADGLRTARAGEPEPQEMFAQDLSLSELAAELRIPDPSSEGVPEDVPIDLEQDGVAQDFYWGEEEPETLLEPELDVFGPAFGSHASEQIDGSAPDEEVAKVKSRTEEHPERERVSRKQADIELRLPAQPNMEVLAARTVEDLAVANDYAPDLIEDLRIATMEACLSAIERDREHVGSFALQVDANGEAIAIALECAALGAVAQDAAESALDALLGRSRRERIEQLVDRLEAETVGGFVRLRMTLRNRPPRPSDSFEPRAFSRPRSQRASWSGVSSHWPQSDRLSVPKI